MMSLRARVKCKYGILRILQYIAHESIYNWDEVWLQLMYSFYS